MHKNSRQIDGQKEQVHPNLAAAITKHCNALFARPVQSYNQIAFESFLAQWNTNTPLILDTGCGTGDSSRNLARLNPSSFVVGVDQSEYRLTRQRESQDPDNLLLLRADLVDFWRLCTLHNVRPEKHYLLYPNPWPKKKHFQRRWCGHPVLPFIIAVGGRLEFRTNWHIYANEFQFALQQLSFDATQQEFTPDSPLTPFELKYQQSGHQLFKVSSMIEQFSCSALDAWLAENQHYLCK